MTEGSLRAAIDAIDRICWESMPTPDPPSFSRRPAARGLHALALATNQVQAAGATTYLFDSVLVDSHLGTVMPAAVAAAPILVIIAEHGHPWARSGARSVLEAMLEYYPFDGFNRVDTADCSAVPLCCAVAHHVGERSEALAARGSETKELLASVDEHWRFEVAEVLGPDAEGHFAFGDLTGVLPGDPVDAELHTPAGLVTAITIEAEYPPSPGGTEACLRVGVADAAGLHNAILLPARCGRRVY